VYLGTPEVAVVPLRALVADGYDVALVVSSPDKRRGRGSGTRPSPVKAAALEMGLPVTDAVDDVLGVEADLGVVVAYGQLLRPPVLAHVPLVNLHFSLLPRWRGAAPVERAILAGDTETGVCLMAIGEGLDTGGVYSSATLDIGDDETLDALRARLVAAGTDLLLSALRSGFPAAVPQQGEATYAAKIEGDEHELDWTRPAVDLHRVVRLGRAWTSFRGGRFKVHEVRRPTGDQAADDELGEETPLAPGEVRGLHVGTGTTPLELVTVQPEGKPAQPADAWRNGARLTPGERLGT
jgi:methionyl-tRNA formyltransferase